MKRIIISVLLAVLLVTSLIACSSKNGTMERDTYPADTAAYYSEPMEAADGYFKGASNYYASEIDSYMEAEDYSLYEKPVQNDLAERKIIKTGNIRFQTTAYEEMISALETAVAEYSGYVQSSNQYGGGVYDYNALKSSRYSIRIPAENYEMFMKSVCTLGTVTSRDESKDDVTMSYVDMESRLAALEAEHKALIEMLEKATEMYDVIALHDRLSDLTYEIEGYKAQLRKYDDLISYCTVNIYVEEVRKAVVNEEKLSIGERMSLGLSDTMEDIKTGLEEFSVDFVTNLPYIIILVVIHLIMGLIALIIVKSIKRKRRKARASADKTAVA